MANQMLPGGLTLKEVMQRLRLRVRFLHGSRSKMDQQSGGQAMPMAKVKRAP